MRASEYKPQVDALVSAIQGHVGGPAVDLGIEHHSTILLLLHWVDYLKKSQLTGCCDEILDGVRATLVEASGCIALGLIRPALFALRAQIDAALAWLYFKDHPIEWEHLLRTGDGFKARLEVVEYLGRFIDKYSARFAVLNSHRTRTVEQPYRLLSAHIHGQSSLLLPSFQNLAAMVYSERRCAEAIRLQSEVAEYINDIFLACYAGRWSALPDEIVQGAKSRVPTLKQAQLFS